MSNSKFFIALLVFVIVVIGGFALLNRGKAEKSDYQIKSNNKIEVGDHVLGNKKAPVLLIEYGDFQCPSCGQFYVLLHQLEKDYQDKLVVVFRDYPLTTIHPNAMAAHKAAESVNLQNESYFFKMHDLLYQNQEAWSNVTNPASIFEGYAKQIGADVDEYKKNLDSSKVIDRIGVDQASGEAADITGTPTIFVNGKKLDNTQTSTYQKVKAVVDEALKSKDKN